MRNILQLLLVLLLSTSWAQKPPSVVNYSRLTKAFDRIVPFGEDFQIKGIIPSNVMAVRVESFGFLEDQMKVETLEPLFKGKDVEGNTFCNAIIEARRMASYSTDKGKRIPNASLAWERPNDNSSITQFTVNHSQLYYGRTYIFLITYYEMPSGDDTDIVFGEAKKVIVAALKSSIVNNTLIRTSNASKSINIEELEKEIQNTFQAHSTMCPDQLISYKRLQPAFSEVTLAVVDVVKNTLWAQIEADENAGVLLANYQDYNFDGAANLIAKKLKTPGINQVLSASSVRPYLQNMEAQNKFLISLDGGLVYVAEFEQLIPTVGFNLKINPIDFNDPYNPKTEWSVILGMGMSKPDDLDPDYEGIFSGSDRSLVTGVGARFPKFSKLIRFQVGGLWYRQKSPNPLIKDFSTDVSWYFGISLNWDTIDFASKLFNSRTQFNLN